MIKIIYCGAHYLQYRFQLHTFTGVHFSKHTYLRIGLVYLFILLLHEVKGLKCLVGLHIILLNICSNI